MASTCLTAGDSDNPHKGALNTHGQTGTRLERGSQLSSGEGHAGISPSASGQRDQEAERPAVRQIDDLRVILAALEKELQLYLSTGMRVTPGRLALWLHEIRLAKASEPQSRVDRKTS